MAFHAVHNLIFQQIKSDEVKDEEQIDQSIVKASSELIVNISQLRREPPA